MTESDQRPPDWRLPAGVTPGLWDYLHDPQLAERYDARLIDSPLSAQDELFVAKHLVLPGKTIDIGCGTGRSLVPLAQRGFDILGVDLSDRMLAVATDKFRAHGLDPAWVKANIVELDAIAADSFNYCLCLFSTLGMISGREYRQRALDHARRILHPGGLFLLHIHNRWHSLWNPTGRRWLIRDILRSITNHPERGDLVMPFHQGIANLRMHLFTLGEVRNLLAKAGFECFEVECVMDANQRQPTCLGWLRAQGFLMAARKL